MRWLMLLCSSLMTLPLLGCTPDCEPVPPGELGELTGWEQTFLEESRLPQVSDEARHFLSAEDGLQLAYTDWVPASWTGDGAVVLFVHGSSAHGALYAALGESMAEAGVYARIIDLRGHGYSRCVEPGRCDPMAVPDYAASDETWPGRPGDSADVNQLTRDLQAHLTDLARLHPRARLLLAGHSSGAGLVARYVEHAGMAHLDGVALLAPFLHADQPQNTRSEWECGRVVGTSYARVDLGALGDARRRNPHRYVLSLDKPPELIDPLDTLRYTLTTMEGLAVTDVERFHASLTGPTLWVAAEDDALMDLEASREVYARIPGGAGFVTVRDTSHVGIIWSAQVGQLLATFAADTQAPLPESLHP
jgi:alpha-beta hydrolase superfamily lysophospholipase